MISTECDIDSSPLHVPSLTIKIKHKQLLLIWCFSLVLAYCEEILSTFHCLTI